MPEVASPGRSTSRTALLAGWLVWTSISTSRSSPVCIVSGLLLHCSASFHLSSFAGSSSGGAAGAWSSRELVGMSAKDIVAVSVPPVLPIGDGWKRPEAEKYNPQRSHIST
jgi:hypothetical protein